MRGICGKNIGKGVRISIKNDQWRKEDLIKAGVSCALLEGTLAVSCVSNKRVYGICKAVWHICKKPGHGQNHRGGR